MPSANVRISEGAHRMLRDLARKEQESMQAVLEKAIETYRRQRFLEAANAAYAALRRNRKVWQEEQNERELWDNSLMDRLDE